MADIEDPVGIFPITPQGTNSTMFTMCCMVAICDIEELCPNCRRKVVGYSVPQDERRKMRWEHAIRYWKGAKP